MMQRELMFVGGIQRQFFANSDDSDENYYMRVLKHIYMRTYGIDPRLTNIKRRSDFFLMI